MPTLRRLVGLLPAGSSARAAPDPPTDVYMWNGRTTEFHYCQNYGCVSHWSPVDRERNRMGVNARLMEPEILAGAWVRHLDGANTDEYID
jgi:hypothetical protein